MTIRAVLFDVGGPIDTEVTHELIVDRHIAEAFRAAGQHIADADLAAASEWAVSVFAPDAYSAMIWWLSAGDRELAVRAYARFGGRSEERLALRAGIELRPGIDETVRKLAARGLLLGLAANQPTRVLSELDRVGIGHLFAHREVSGHHGFRKPDVRLFLRACEDLEVAPEECIVVGDRVDNDVFPAKLLGMRAILFRTGRHIGQQPMTVDELPDVEVTNVQELDAALRALIDAG